MNYAIYPGSFDPFTNGHLDMVIKASKLFDEVHILIAENPNKKRMFNSYDMKCAIEYTLMSEEITNVKVVELKGLVAEYADKNDIHYMIRGLRNNLDYNYEENIAQANKLINPTLECIYFRADSPAISSTMVKELWNSGYGIRQYVPRDVAAQIYRKDY